MKPLDQVGWLPHKQLVTMDGHIEMNRILKSPVEVWVLQRACVDSARRPATGELRIQNG